jgi:hypothetical protein
MRGAQPLPPIVHPGVYHATRNAPSSLDQCILSDIEQIDYALRMRGKGSVVEQRR